MSKQQDQKKSKPQQREENLQQEKLTAIILLDSYTNKFEPLSSTRAECLLPLIGDKTLLDNNFEFLVENGVEEIFLFCTRHHQQIKAHIEEKRWRRVVELHFMYNFKCQSFGDAMREIDAKGIVRSNFILLTATGFISNIGLKDHLEKHKQTCKTDRNAVMTIMCVNNQNDLVHLSGQKDQSKTLIVHDINRKVLHYDNVSQDRKGSNTTTIPFNILDKAYTSMKQSVNITQQAVDSANAKFKLQQQQVQFSLNATSGYQGGSSDTVLHLKTIQNRFNLTESQIYLCSPDVLHMFTDNFDFESMKDFVHGVLNEEEVSGYTIYIDEFNQTYGSHFGLINSLNSYFNETMRLLQRTDLVLDYNSRAKYRRLIDSINVYLAKNSFKFGNDTKFQRNVFVDSSTKIGEKCQLVNCFIGSNCVIGNNVKLSNTIIWQNSRIGNDSVLNGCFIGSNVKIGNNCSIVENTLFGDYCKVKDATKMTERGVFSTKESEKFRTRTKSNGTDESCDEKDATKLGDLTKKFENLSLDVKESNYSKYVLSHRSLAEDDENSDDDFGSADEGDNYDDDDDNVSVATGGSEARHNDTSKNNHFLVINPRLRKDSKSKSRQNHHGSNLDLSYESSDGYESETDDDFDKDGSGQENDSEEEERGHEDEAETFYKEVVELLKSALKEKLDPSNVILEINSRKHANGIQIDDVSYYLAKSMLHLPIVLSGISLNKSLKEQQDLGQSIDYLGLLKANIKNFVLVLKNYYTKTKQSQRLFLNSLQDFFIETRLHSDQAANVFLDRYFVKTLHFMYDECEFLDEDIVIEWYDKQVEALDANKGKDVSKMDKTQKVLAEKILKKAHSINKLKPFIDWLKEDDEDDDEDDEE